jgi:hypothetical protein
VHRVFGGNSRLVVGASQRTPNVFMFLNPSGGYASLRWDNSVLIASGGAQRGRTDFSQENLSIMTHLRRGRPLRVFQVRGSWCLYEGEFVIDQERPIEDWAVTGKKVESVFSGLDIRSDICVPLFRIKRVDGVGGIQDVANDFDGAPHVSIGLRVEQSSLAVWNGRVGAKRINASHGRQAKKEMVRNLVDLIEADVDAVRMLGKMDGARVLSTLVQHEQRISDIAALEALVKDPGSREIDLQKQLESMTWVFGGEFLSRVARRALTVGSQLDFSLIRPDGSLHGVEIKKARIPGLVKKHRGQFVAGSEINDAVGQAMNYLRSLDEQYHRILADFDIDCRRASMTVVVGYSPFVKESISARSVAEAIRTHNSHLARIEVVTYDQLIDSAKRSLSLSKYTDPFEGA